MQQALDRPSTWASKVPHMNHNINLRRFLSDPSFETSLAACRVRVCRWPHLASDCKTHHPCRRVKPSPWPFTTSRKDNSRQQQETTSTKGQQQHNNNVNLSTPKMLATGTDRCRTCTRFVHIVGGVFPQRIYFICKSDVHMWGVKETPLTASNLLDCYILDLEMYRDLYILVALRSRNCS